MAEQCGSINGPPWLPSIRLNSNASVCAAAFSQPLDWRPIVLGRAERSWVAAQEVDCGYQRSA